MLEANQKTVKIPVSSRLHIVDREQAQQISRWIITPNDAHKLVAQSKDSPWRIRQTDMAGRAFVLTYKGCEMRLLFKRQIIEEVMEVGFPIPAQAIRNSEEEWLSINLIDDAEKTVADRKGTSELKKQVQLLEQQLNDTRSVFIREKADLLDDITKWQSLAEKAVEKSEGLERKVHSLEADIKLRNFRAGKDRILAEQKVMADMTKAFMPIVNALSRAEKADWIDVSLKAMEQALGTLGLEVIKPEVGDVFNPQIHNAVEILPMEKKYEDQLVAVHSVGLIQKETGNVLKPADVAVATYSEKEKESNNE